MSGRLRGSANRMRVRHAQPEQWRPEPGVPGTQSSEGIAPSTIYNNDIIKCCKIVIYVLILHFYL